MNPLALTADGDGNSIGSQRWCGVHRLLMARLPDLGFDGALLLKLIGHATDLLLLLRRISVIGAPEFVKLPPRGMNAS